MANICLILGISVLVAVIILLLLNLSYKKSIKYRESYGPSSSSPQKRTCNGVYPPYPSTMPPSAYAQLMTPIIPTSADNPMIQTTMQDDPTGNWNFYTDKNVCNTPWKMQAFNNDSCAQFGIGERAEGPPGHKFCVCNTIPKTGKQTSNPKDLKADNIIIDIGGVCTQDNQCCTNKCLPVEGQFSKSCQCPVGQGWNDELGVCESELKPNHSAFSGMYDNSAGEYYPSPPPGAATLTGKLCASNNECSLGDACTPDNFCASQIINDNERDANKFMVGANCETDSQCTHNLICSKTEGNTYGQCSCPPNLIFEWSSRECQCADGSKSIVGKNNACVNQSNVPRRFCPSVPGYFTDSIKGCGLAEKFNPSTNQCLCVANLDTIQPGKIETGGLCDNSNQCALGFCTPVAGVNVCVDPNVSLYSVATFEYL